MERATSVASRQHGVIGLRQATEAGLSWHQVSTLVESGVWSRRAREVFAVAGAPRTFESDVMVACLAGGPEAMACRGTVARLLGIGRPWFDDAGVEIALPRGASVRAVRTVGATVHVYRALGARDQAFIGTIPATKAARLVVDLLDAHPVEAVFAVADDLMHRRWTSSVAIRRLWAESRGRHRSVLDAVLLPWTSGPRPGSPKEMALSRVLQMHGLPRPVRQYEVHAAGCRPRYLDLAYPGAKVAPEYDGRREHGTRQWVADAEREDELSSLGWLRLPAGAADLIEPGATAYCERVRTALEMRSA